MLRVFSGEYCLCDVGIDTKYTSHDGGSLHTGDFVKILSGYNIGTDIEEWIDKGITLVVSSQYTTYSNGNIESNKENIAYVMGIRDCGFNSPDWRIELVKKYTDVVDGEKWPNYGFSFREID